MKHFFKKTLAVTLTLSMALISFAASSAHAKVIAKKIKSFGFVFFVTCIMNISTVNANDLDLICENTLAVQTNFQKEFFDSYSAATDSRNSRFTKNSKGEVLQFYPADSDTESNKFTILKKTFHNLSGNQAYLDGIGVNDGDEKYIKSISFHRNKKKQWAIQITNSGNNEDKLFHRMYFYECAVIKDIIR